MDLVKNVQLSFIIVLAIYTNVIQGQDPNQENCTIDVGELEKLDVVVYTNGESLNDILWIDMYCEGLNKGMPYDQYSPTTIKVGAAIICDDSNVCVCPNAWDEEADCTQTYRHACVAEILGEEEYKNFLCCIDDMAIFDECVAQFPDLATQIETCMCSTGPGSPQDIVLKNAQEAIDNGAKVDEVPEPYFLFAGDFNACVNKHVFLHWLPTVCALLKPDISESIQNCGDPSTM